MQGNRKMIKEMEECNTYHTTVFITPKGHTN